MQEQSTIVEVFFKEPNTASSFPPPFLIGILNESFELSILEEDNPKEKIEDTVVIRSTEEIASTHDVVIKMHLNFEPLGGQKDFLKKLKDSLLKKFNTKEPGCLKEGSIWIQFPQK